MKLSTLFSDGAVLQQNREIVIFGEGEGTATVEFLGEKKTATAKNGLFEMTFSAHKAGGPYEIFADLNGEKVIVKDVYVGEVIIIAGQSNAQLMICETGFKPEKSVNDPLARTYHIPQFNMNNKFDNCWNEMSDDNFENWSALAAHISREYRAEHDVAVGTVCCYQAASVIQSFLKPENSKKFTFDKELVHIDHFIDDFKDFNQPSFIYDLMVKKMIPYTCDCVVWYQGESNTAEYEGSQYKEMLKALIDEWREYFNDPKLPFAIIQINKFTAPYNANGWENVRKAQLEISQEYAYCRSIKIDDLGEHENIHPTKKYDVAKRAYAALKDMNIF